MNRLASTLCLDITQQYRYGFYWVTVYVSLLSAAALVYLFDHESLHFILPGIFLLTLPATTMFFIAGMMLFEKSEKIFDALLVSPLGIKEYFSSKLLSFTLLAALEVALVTTVSYGWKLNWIWFIAGTVFMSLFFLLFGMCIVVRYESMSDFLLPGGVLGSLVQLPVFAQFFILDESWFYLFPTMPSLLLLNAAFADLEAWKYFYGVIGSVVWVAVFYQYARICFKKFIVLKEQRRV